MEIITKEIKRIEILSNLFEDEKEILSFEAGEKIIFKEYPDKSFLTIKVKLTEFNEKILGDLALAWKKLEKEECSNCCLDIFWEKDKEAIENKTS